MNYNDKVVVISKDGSNGTVKGSFMYPLNEWYVVAYEDKYGNVMDGVFNEKDLLPIAKEI